MEEKCKIYDCKNEVGDEHSVCYQCSTSGEEY